MDTRLLAALVSSIICEVAIILLQYTCPCPSSSSSSSFNSLWPILVEVFQSSQAVAATLIQEKPTISTKRRRLMLSNNIHFDGIIEAASFKANLKMSASTFEWLCTQMEPFLDVGVSVSQQVGMGLFRLATGSSYHSVSQRFGSAEPIARLCTKRLCRLLCTNFRHLVAYPSVLQQVSADFEAIGGMPNCCGAIDCTRFNFVMGPGASNQGTEGLQHSVVTQILVDSCSRILNVITGFHGEKGDSRVLRSSTLYSDVQQGRMLNSHPLCLNGVDVPQYLVGDSGYPLLPWLMVPYADPVVGSFQEDFNTKHYLMRQTALRTIACLRNWGLLSKPIEDDVRVGVACIGACAILHNIVLDREGGGDVLEGIEDYGLHDQSSQYYRDASEKEYLIEKKASVIRDALALKARDV